MDDGTGQGGEGGKKRVAREDVDSLLYLHAQSTFGDAPALEDEDNPPDELDLGYTLTRAYDLWQAWRDHGVLPRAGGYDDQPQRWQRMISVMNQRYRRAYDRARDEHYPDDENDTPRRNGRREQEMDASDVIASFSGNGNTRPSWEQFRGGLT